MRLHHETEKKALVIGSGIGGLSTAIILAGLGFDVTVIEKNRRPGGMLRSYVRQGVHCNVGVHYMGALGPGQVLRRCFDYLGIARRLPLIRMGVDVPWIATISTTRLWTSIRSICPADSRRMKKT